MVDLIWIAAFIVFAIWWLIITDLDKAGILKKHNMTAIGPIVMIRTFKGQKLLDWMARPKGLWRALTLLGMPVVIASMVIMLVTLVGMDVWMLLRMQDLPPPGPANSPQNILAIPGLNQFIPFWWGWVALIVALIAHEFSHAILAKVEGIRVNSLGLMLMPVPIGAFAEIDEEELFGTKSEGTTSDIIGPMETKAPGEGKRKASPRQFVNILGAGVIANFIVAFVAFALLFGPVLGAIAATGTDVVVYEVAPGSPADLAGIKPNMIITSIDGTPVTSVYQLNALLHAIGNNSVTISGLLNNKEVNYTVPVNGTDGVYIVGVMDDDAYPAKQAGIKPNMRLVAINGTPVYNTTGFSEYMNHTLPGQQATLTMADVNGTMMNFTVVLGQGAGGHGQIGVYSTDNPIGLSVGQFAKWYLEGLRSMPFSASGWLRIMILPVLQFNGDDPGFSIFQGEFSSLYQPVGWAASFGALVYGLAECLFWIGWLNFNVGLFNCLPMIPLDGGHIFREATRTFMGRFIKDTEVAERVSKAIVNGFAVTLLASIIFTFMAPYLAQWMLG
ncbi:site-2 protease family protein [Methanocella conradii]|uniref:site-2 protease family protein n=1 Tax=Methanocella conradii TaxID=1175444 RepID=UPI0024B3B9FC|nr:site-2 protease family protein [Methanocella conradii]MDI6897381.1 site-2 protease family protein [Methanocella conradii]